MAIKEIVGKLVEGQNLTVDESVAAMTEIMEGAATDAQISAFITALRIKGETPEEITGCAKVMREKATRIDCGEGVVVDTCGTGGDAKGTFNISTAAAFVAAGAGLKIAKHGNRAVSSHSGSADVLKTLGVNIEADVRTVERCIRLANIGFLFAPLLHGAMKFAIGPRREIGIRTIFNALGPLTNPGGASRQVIGVYAGEITETIAEVLKNLGSERSFVVHGADGLDEITTTAETRISELSGGKIDTYIVSPEDFGLQRAKLADLVVHTHEESADILRRILDGESGPRRGIVLLNGAAAIAAGGLCADIQKGLDLAAESIDSGRAKRALDALVELSN